jgi:cytochrome bd-type quinol oxidase subunit 2
VLSAILDEAYERADQRYRNAAKLLAVVVATLLALAGGWLIYYHPGAATCPAATLPAACPPAPNALPWWSYFASGQFGLALLVGLSATPLAPVAKDLASSLQAAAAAVGAARRLVP